jgi:hypothetical protein
MRFSANLAAGERGLGALALPNVKLQFDVYHVARADWMGKL